jgi:choline-sulfatase
VGGIDLPGAAQAARRPNILFVCSDQHTGRMPLGGPPVQTPNLARLASMGVTFRNAYCGSPVCAPSRASLMTGRFASDVGSYGNATPFDGRATTWGARLRQAGYTTWATGKMDLTTEADLGFEQVNTNHGHWTRPDITELFRRPLCYRVEERQLVDGKVGDRSRPDKARLDAAVAFVKARSRASGSPWAAFVGVVTPHPEFEAPEKYWQLYPPAKMTLPNIPAGHLDDLHPVFQGLRGYSMIATPIPEERVRRARSAYYGMVTQLDEHIGAMVDELEPSGDLTNTILIYTADHGEMLGEHGLWLKRTLLEGAARVPLIMVGPGLPAGRVIDTPVSHVDLIATLLDVGGVPPSRELRGTSLLPLIGGADAGPRAVYAECHTEGNCTGSFMIRQGDWKYVYFSYYGKNLLYNLREDPGELTNLSGRPSTAAIEQDLRDTLAGFVDADGVTTRAFEQQDRVVRRMVESNKADEFCHLLEGRLGRGQAIVLTQKEYPGWRAV